MPVVQVKLIHSVRPHPIKSTVVPVQQEGGTPARGLALLDYFAMKAPCSSQTPLCMLMRVDAAT